ncbi:MAG: TonB-dependent receptor, partial [Proteobacteria bacterium]|nr:TonB-dependent receptor [Pseudomonadota bacterium]
MDLPLRPLFLALLALPSAAFAGAIEGFVFEAGSGAVLEGVSVTVGEQSLTTDAGGAFSADLERGLYDVAVGEHSIGQVVVGETGVSEVLVTLAADGSVSAQVEMPDASTLDGIVVEDAPLGVVSGVITDDEEGGPVADVRIFVKGLDADARTDANGRFDLEIPAGSWELSIIRSGYATRSVSVECVSGEERNLDLSMVPTGVQLADFTVTAPAIEGNTASLLAERQDSAQVADVIGAEQMSKTGDSTAAAALRRVTGLTLVDGKFVYVRGLGERYSATLLNGASLPSPEPERRVVPLDMFPASMLDSIVVQKTFSPDMPAEFGGGVVQIRTRSVPETPFVKVGLSGSYVSDTTFKRTLTSEGSSTDWLGMDGGFRGLPEAVQDASDNSPLEEGDMFSDRGYSAEKLEELGEAMPNRWNLSEGRAAPNGGINMQGGGSVDTGWGRFGVLAGMLYSRQTANNDREELYYVIEGGEERPSHSYDFTETTDTVRLGGLFTASVEVGDEHRVSLTTLVNRITDDEARSYEGENRDVGAAIRIGRLRWLERQLVTQQLLGHHVLPADLELDYRYTFSTASRLEPDRREYRLDNEPGTDVWRMSDRPEGNQRFFSTLADQVHDTGLDLMWPIALGEDRVLRLKAGGVAMFKDRAVDSRRFKYMHKGERSRDQDILAQDVESILSSENIGPDGFQFEEITRQTDNYGASQRLFAGYLLADADLTASTRVLAGARVEKSTQTVSTFELFNPDSVPVGAGVDTTDVLPAVTLTQGLSVEGMQLRAGYGRTLNRPDFREMSPASFNDVTGGRLQRGNPNLGRATIDNVDLRWEYYPTPGESLSVAVFAKSF